MNNVHEELWDLSARLSLTKIEEALAEKKRIAIEEQIALLVPGPDVGQKTVKLKNGASITVKRGLNYKADLEKIDGLFLDFGQPELVAPIKTKTTRELDAVEYEWYGKKHPDVFRLLTEYVVVAPKKVAVTLKAARGE